MKFLFSSHTIFDSNCNAGVADIYLDLVTGQMQCVPQGTNNGEILGIIFGHFVYSPHLIGIMFEVNLHTELLSLFEVCFFYLFEVMKWIPSGVKNRINKVHRSQILHWQRQLKWMSLAVMHQVMVPVCPHQKSLAQYQT